MIDEKYIEKLDSFDIRWFRFLINDKGGEVIALNSLLESLDCTKVYPDGSRPVMTINYGYRRDIAGFLYIVDELRQTNNDLADTFITKLINRHEENLAFEQNETPIRYTAKPKRSVTTDKRTTRAKDIFSDNTLDVTNGSAKAVKAKNNARTRKAEALAKRTVSFAFNNFKVSSNEK